MDATCVSVSTGAVVVPAMLMDPLELRVAVNVPAPKVLLSAVWSVVTDTVNAIFEVVSRDPPDGVPEKAKPPG